MIISFFEEFSSKDNLDKLNLVKFPTKLYLAAKSLNEFNKIKNSIKNKNVKEMVYWPILKKSEGYWISPFSKRKALLRIFNELRNKNVPVMLDLELPTSQNIFLYLTQLTNFSRNKKLIKKLIDEYKGKVYLCEYFPEKKNSQKILKLLGLHFENKKVKIIKMFYHSMHNFSTKFVKEEFKRGVKGFKDNYIVAIGTIAKGIKGTEPLLKEKLLKEDLMLAKQAGVKEVIIFRLGGLNKKYLRLLK
jgi:hypothetical protein